MCVVEVKKDQNYAIENIIYLTAESVWVQLI